MVNLTPKYLLVPLRREKAVCYMLSKTVNRCNGTCLLKLPQYFLLQLKDQAPPQLLHCHLTVLSSQLLLLILQLLRLNPTSLLIRLMAESHSSPWKKKTGLVLVPHLLTSHHQQMQGTLPSQLMHNLQ